MPVDIPKLYTPTGGLNRAAPSAAPASAELALKPGEHAQAQVLKSTPLSALIGNKLLTGSSATTPNSSNPESARDALLNTYRSAMARNEMHLAALLIKGTSVTTVIDRPLAKGQILDVYLTPERRLTALNVKFDGPNMASRVSAKTTELLEALKPVLRELLPRQGQQDLLSQLRRLPAVSANMTPVGGDKSLTKLLGQIDRLALDANAAPSGKAVRQALEQSGTLLEPRLARAVQGANPDRAVKEVLTQDLKAALLQYLAPIKTTASSANTAAARAEQTAIGPLASELALPSLMQMLGNHSLASGGESLRMLQTQLVLLMHQLSLNSLARIRLNQLQPEARSSRGGEAAAGPVQLAFDIPIRLDGHLYPAHIEIQEQEEAEDNPEAGAQQDKLWQVNLTLDPPHIGELFVRLRLRGDELKLAFWSQQPQALKKAQEAFGDIKNALQPHDIAVREVLFNQGAPPHKGNKLSYHLVDIKT